MNIEARQVCKRFGHYTALDDVSLTVCAGELVALLGPSGSGKTTLLRLIAGLEAPDSGAVTFDGEDTTHRLPRDRGVGFVFQHYALFRHMSVFENVAFGLRVRPRRQRPPESEIRARVGELLSLVQLEGLAQRAPDQLSGGQRQRVALARALAVEPRVLLLDEPFGALDARVRQELRQWLRRLHDQLQITSIFVTHDQEEALEVADRVVVMNRGRIEQDGTPADVYNNPASSFVFHFLGNVNLFRGRVQAGRLRIGEVEVPLPGLAEGAATAYVRPHELVLERSPNGEPALPAEVRQIRAVGPLVRLRLAHPGEPAVIEAEMSLERFAELALEVGERVFARPRQWRVFAETGA